MPAGLQQPFQLPGARGRRMTFERALPARGSDPPAFRFGHVDRLENVGGFMGSDDLCTGAEAFRRWQVIVEALPSCRTRLSPAALSSSAIADISCGYPHLSARRARSGGIQERAGAVAEDLAERPPHRLSIGDSHLHAQATSPPFHGPVLGFEEGALAVAPAEHQQTICDDLAADEEQRQVSAREAADRQVEQSCAFG